MTVQILLGDEIRSTVLRILSGDCVFIRRSQTPTLYIISPWLSDVRVDFSDRYVSQEIKAVNSGEKDYSSLQDYNIKAINLAYALLLFKLHASSGYSRRPPEVNIVTLPPKEPSYSPQYIPRINNLLSFLDEIGCNVFINSNLHSKVLLSNDLALIGSFNFTNSALLYDREEIGVSINDLDNLEVLQKYCVKLIGHSERFGYTSLHNCREMWTEEQREIQNRISERPDEETLDVLLSKLYKIYEGQLVRRSAQRVTRGLLLEMLVDGLCTEGLAEFLDITGGYDRFVESYARDLNLFYETSIVKLLATEGAQKLLERNFDYNGKADNNSMIEFINKILARPSVPFIRLQVEPLF